MSKEVEREQEMMVIHATSRKEAIDDGVLVDVSEMAREAGFRHPTALTRAVYERYMVVPPGAGCQDELGRLWDILWMARFGQGDSVGNSVSHFQLYVRNDNSRPRLVTLKAVCGPGDDEKPVVTIMLPDED